MNTASDTTEQKAPSDGHKPGLTVRIMSFGYKLGKPPSANALFDVRFLKNPYWVEHLRPMTGKDHPVQEYVMNQQAAKDFLESMADLLERLVPRLQESHLSEFSIAFGCTGGQHRSTTMVELLAQELSKRLPELTVERIHRELDKDTSHGKHAKHEDGL